MEVDAKVEADRGRAIAMLQRAGILITLQEEAAIVLADMGLGEFERQGVAILPYINTDRYCAKELIFLPHQTCPQHRCPPVNGQPGKQETFRCRYGRVYLYVEDAPTRCPHCRAPYGSEDAYTVWHEIVLTLGEQYTVAPDTWHWFQAGEEGAVVSEFASASHDEDDIFADARIVRVPVETTLLHRPQGGMSELRISGGRAPAGQVAFSFSSGALRRG